MAHRVSICPATNGTQRGFVVLPENRFMYGCPGCGEYTSNDQAWCFTCSTDLSVVSDICCQGYADWIDKQNEKPWEVNYD